MALTIAPFFVVVYYLIALDSEYNCKMLVVNNDRGIVIEQNDTLIYSDSIIKTITAQYNFVILGHSNSVEEARKLIEDKKYHIVLSFPENYSETINSYIPGGSKIPIELYGDMASFDYLMGAVWAYESVKLYVNDLIKTEDPYEIVERPVGITSGMSEFDFYIPGMLVFAIVMLLFTASIALIKDIENGTIKRMILAGMPVFSLVGGISVVQIVLGFAGVAISLILAVALGFSYSGSLFTIILITLLACISVIAFSIIVAALTRSANQILVVGVFPMFLFMFFSGVMFPIPSSTLFTIAGYDFCFNSLISTTPAVTALQKVMLYGQGISDVIPEILLMLCLSFVYILIGGFLFRRRHLRQLS